jgi:hypothetical protein
VAYIAPGEAAPNAGPVERKLTAILAADVAGYRRLVGLAFRIGVTRNTSYAENLL